MQPLLNHGKMIPFETPVMGETFTTPCGRKFDWDAQSKLYLHLYDSATYEHALVVSQVPYSSENVLVRVGIGTAYLFSAGRHVHVPEGALTWKRWAATPEGVSEAIGALHTDLGMHVDLLRSLLATLEGTR